MPKLYEDILNYTKQNYIPMHTPGHKRNKKFMHNYPIEIDITEIDKFDNLHNMQGLLKTYSEKIANTYKVLYSYMLINGSSGGILSAIYSQTEFEDKVIVARNCHKSVYNAIEIKHLKPVYIMPDYNEEFCINLQINPSELENVIKQNQDAKLVIITSPTYEGIASDIKKISSICHNYNMLLIVDEAHGAHLGFNDKFIDSARELGADLVINSLHKTLPAPTQCAVAHICSEQVNKQKFERALSIFETSSPSYIFLSAIDNCIDILNENKDIFNKYYNNLKSFYAKCEHLKNLKLLYHHLQKNINYDIGKIIISTKNTTLTGIDLAKRLKKDYKIEIEMCGTNYIIAMTSICDDETTFNIFANALLEIDKSCEPNTSSDKYTYASILPQKYLQINEALSINSGKHFNLNDCKDKVCLEYIWLYPPGIPLIVPGEIITKNIIDLLKNIKTNKLEVKSDTSLAPNKILCCEKNKA